MQINIIYFASLKDKVGLSEEKIETQSQTVDELYEELDQKYHFPLEKDYLRVAVNEEYKSFDTLLNNNDTIVFIPPVAGG